ncbi:hypothetical protein ES708_29474 [subsurface metagenome]
MLIPTIIMGVLAVTLLIIGYAKGQGQHIDGIKIGIKTILQIMPLLIFALMIAGMVQVLIPQEVLSKWVGIKSGLRGIFIGAAAGGLTPGGPFVSLPVAAGLLRSGASMGTTVAFITGWSLLGITRIPMEVGIMGWKFTLIRLGCTCLFAPIAGLIAQALFSRAQ